MEDLGGIIWRATIDTQGMTTAEKQVGKSTGKVEKDFKRVERSGDRLATTMGRVAKAVGSVLAVRQLQQFVINTAQAVDTQAKFAQSIDVSFDSLQKLQFAVEQNGATTNEFNNSIRRLARRTEEASRGTGSAVQAFKELGLEAKDLKNLSPDEIFLRVADSFTKLEGSGKEVSTAFGLFDTEGAKLINTLRLGRDGISKLGDEAQRTGRVISDEAAANAAKFNDEMNKMQGAVKGAAVNLGVELLPALTSIIESFTDFVADGENVDKVIQGMTVVAQAAAVLFLGRFVGSMVASVRAMQGASIAARTLAASMAFLGGPVGWIVTVVGALGLLAYTTRKTTAAQEESAGVVANLAQDYDKLGKAQARLLQIDIAKEMLSVKESIESLTDPIGTAQNLLSGFGQDDLGDLGDYLNIDTGTVEENSLKAQAAVDKLKDRLEALTEAQKKLNQILSGDDQKESNEQSKESIDVITKLALANEEYRAELAGTSDELEVRRALQAAGVSEGTAEAAVIRSLIEANREYAQSISDAAIAKAEAKAQEEAAIGAFGDVKETAEFETMSPRERLEAEYAERMAVIEEYSLLEVAKEEEIAEAKLAVQQAYQDKLRDMENARMSLILGSSAQIFGDLSDLARSFAGEQSGIYKGLFAVSKAFSIAQSIMAITTGIAQAAAIPFPANIGAMASVAGATAGLVSTIQGTQMGGGRLYGGNVNPNSMHPVTEDGRPELLMQGGKQYLLPGARGGEVISNRDMGGATNNVSIEMPIAIHGDANENMIERIKDALFDSETDLVAAVERGLNREGRSL